MNFIPGKCFLVVTSKPEWSHMTIYYFLTGVIGDLKRTTEYTCSTSWHTTIIHIKSRVGNEALDSTLGSIRLPAEVVVSIVCVAKETRNLRGCPLHAWKPSKSCVCSPSVFGTIYRIVQAADATGWVSTG